MLRSAQTILWLAVFLVSGCVNPRLAVQPEVQNFLRLLTRTDEPSLAEYSKYGGECGGESELVFELKECHSRGWEEHSKSCVNYTRERCSVADQVPSLELGWLRKQFSTVGKSYRIVSVESKTEGFHHELVEVEIGKNIFLLFHNIDPHTPTGLVIGVSKVNGKNIEINGEINGVTH